MKDGRDEELSTQRGRPIKRTLKKESPIFEKQAVHYYVWNKMVKERVPQERVCNG